MSTSFRAITLAAASLTYPLAVATAGAQLQKPDAPLHHFHVGQVVSVAEVSGKSSTCEIKTAVNIPSFLTPRYFPADHEYMLRCPHRRNEGFVSETRLRPVGLLRSLATRVETLVP